MKIEQVETKPVRVGFTQENISPGDSFIEDGELHLVTRTNEEGAFALAFFEDGSGWVEFQMKWSTLLTVQKTEIDKITYKLV